MVLLTREQTYLECAPKWVRLRQECGWMVGHRLLSAASGPHSNGRENLGDAKVPSYGFA